MQSNQRTAPINPQCINRLLLLQAWFLAEETLVARLPQAEATLLILIFQIQITQAMANCLKAGSIQSIHLTLDINPQTPQLAKHG